MHLTKSVLAASLLALAVAPARDAAACGGCFPIPLSQSESTQVTGHRMILSVSTTQSTLWDQLSYTGNPASFAWVLPVKGMVDIGVSSDALFGNLEQLTRVTINSPTIFCPPPPFCNGSASASNSSGGGSGGVTVVAQQVVGPYETVQLSSQDPIALKTWLTTHNYVIPADIDPIIAAYVAEGFDFLALKLVPGMGIQSMKPVRITTPGASPVLPLRMVAAGTGAAVSLTLWVVGEGKYVPSIFPSFIIPEDKLVWDWDTGQSNYKDLVQAGFAATQGKGWLVEAGEPMSQFDLSNNLTSLAMYNPEASGYADDMGMGAPAACAADLAALFAGISSATTWISRLHGELPRAALGTDLTVGAASDQTTWVQRTFNVTRTTGTPPACPMYPSCSDSGSGSGGSGGSGDDGGVIVLGGCGSCTLGGQADDGTTLGMGALALGAVAAVRRRRDRRSRG